MLHKNTALTTLRLGDSNLSLNSTVEGISKCTALTELNIEDTSLHHLQLRTITSSLPNLQYLNMASNKIDMIEAPDASSFNSSPLNNFLTIFLSLYISNYSLFLSLSLSFFLSFSLSLSLSFSLRLPSVY